MNKSLGPLVWMCVWHGIVKCTYYNSVLCTYVDSFYISFSKNVSRTKMTTSLKAKLKRSTIAQYYTVKNIR